jgi:hypothetical protein
MPGGSSACVVERKGGGSYGRQAGRGEEGEGRGGNAPWKLETVDDFLRVRSILGAKQAVHASARRRVASARFSNRPAPTALPATSWPAPSPPPQSRGPRVSTPRRHRSHRWCGGARRQPRRRHGPPRCRGAGCISRWASTHLRGPLCLPSSPPPLHPPLSFMGRIRSAPLPSPVS